jgi:hypothetical protein
LELGAWSLELGAWSLELGAWSLELGACGRILSFVLPLSKSLKYCSSFRKFMQANYSVYFLPQSQIEPKGSKSNK